MLVSVDYRNIDIPQGWSSDAWLFRAALEARLNAFLSLRAAVRAVVLEQFGGLPVENTGGGTSDARFIAPLGAEVVELGPVNASIHKVNERIALDELERLPALYRAIAERLLLA